MAKKVEIEIDVKGGKEVKGLGQEIRELTKQLRQTPEGTKEWSQIYNKIDDLKDKLAASKKASADWIDTLEGAGGPLGMLGKGLNNVKVATQSFGGALKALGIGLLVSLIGLLVTAFTQTEGSMKKLEPLLIQLEKIFGGIVEGMQPLLDLFLDLAMRAMPVLIDGIKILYGSLMGLFTMIKEVGSGAGKILKGIFTLDTDAISEGYNQLKGSWDETKKAFNQFTENFDKGYAKQTKTEKENAAKAKELADKKAEAAKKAFDEKLKRMEAEDKLDEANLKKLKAEALSLANTEQEKLDVEKKFAELSYQQKIKDLNDKMALYKKESLEYKQLQTDKINAEAEYTTQLTTFKDQQKKINEEADKDAKEKAKKKAEEERAIAFQTLQNQIDDLDKKNKRYDNDFQQDVERLNLRKTNLEQQRELELQAAEGDAAKQLEIRKKYADEIYNTEQAITDTLKAQQEARIALQLQYADAIGQFGNFLQQVAGKNKQLAKAGLLIEKAASVATIIINTQAAASKIAATSILGFADPRAILTYITGGISVATAIAAAVKGVRDIDAAGSGGTGGGGAEAANPNSAANLGRNYGDGGMINGPRHAAGGVMVNAEGGEAIMTRGAVTMFGPLLSALNQAGGGTSFTSGVTGGARPDNAATENPAIAQQPMIMKTYVVSNELTTEQEKLARLKDLSTL
jgi:hypothetical protein